MKKNNTASVEPVDLPIAPQINKSAVFMLSPVGKVLGWNAGAENLTGYCSTEIINQSFTKFLSIENIRRCKSEEVLAAAGVEGKVEYSDWHVGKDSTHFWASLIVTAVYDEHGGVLTFLVEMQITSPNQLAETLQNRNLELEKKLAKGDVELGRRTAQLNERTAQLGVRTAELGERTGQLDERTGELDALTVQLGVRTGQLGDRTSQLTVKTMDFDRAEALNNELEAFTYAASHDLRAPLRSIDGFSLALLEDYSDRLDEEGQDHLNRIRRGAQRMGQLIDDLIGLSSLTRVTLNRISVDLTMECKDIAAELHTSIEGRSVSFKFAEGLTAKCDVALIRIVLQNLLGNALKYTSRTPHADIEVSSLVSDKGIVYFVRDNGAGFNMKYVHKLFGAFQRLHSATDFKGNGIGLATVQRIINRHGGQVWAEGEVDKGTTIYFTL